MSRRNPLNGARLEPWHIGRAYEYEPRTPEKFVKWLRWPGSKTGEPTRDKPIDGINLVLDGAGGEYVWGDGIKLRGAKVRRSGNAIRVEDIFRQTLLDVTIIDRDVVQR